MEERILTKARLGEFRRHLLLEEKSRHTVEKYDRDLQCFMDYVGERPVTKEAVIAFKAELTARGYAPRSVNSMLAPVNRWLSFLGWGDLKVKTLRVQRQAFAPEDRELTREEYKRLLRTAAGRGNRRLELVLMTIAGTGIRVSELRHITAESVRRGEAVVNGKGKSRRILLVKALRRRLESWGREQDISSGPLFVTRGGQPMDRSNVWREMKRLCAQAGVPPSKVFPHNLRHLFARIFYETEKDIAKLADVLGHSSINTTRIYVMTTGAEHRSILELMRLVI